MVEAITAQADEDGRYTASSMYRAWKGWSFADKKNPSPWLTFLVLRVQRRMGVSRCCTVHPGSSQPVQSLERVVGRLLSVCLGAANVETVPTT
jgi:hypothetical protein